LAGFAAVGVPATFTREIANKTTVWIPLWVYLPTPMLLALSNVFDLVQI